MYRRRERTVIRTYRIFNRFLQLTLGTYLKLRFNVRSSGAGILKRLQPPYLLIANHVGYWDPFLLSIFVPQPVYYVAADANFRSPIMRWLLGLVGAIPKTKAMSDMEAVRLIRHVRDEGGIIGVFPEGGRSWDGRTLPLLRATAKLVKLLGIPVVTPIFKGGYLSHPRWSRYPRRGLLRIQYSLGLSGDEVRHLGVDDIHRRITALLDYDEMEYQRTARIVFRGRRLAEYLEHVLFLCPECGNVASMHSSGDRYRCTACRFEVRYTRLGFLEPQQEGGAGGLHSAGADDRPRQELLDDEPSPEQLNKRPRSRPSAAFDTVSAWHRWTLETFTEYLTESVLAETPEPILRDSGVVLRRGYRSSALRTVGTGTLVLYIDRFEIHPARRIPRVFELAEVEGTNIQLTRTLEWYYRDVLYTMYPVSPRTSMYKWEVAIKKLRGLSA